MIRERVERKLEKSGRITPREVLEAYEETGLRPGIECFLNGDEACGIGALMVRDGVDMHLTSDEYQDWVERLNKQAGQGYSLGFYHGFDGEYLDLFFGIDERKGYRDGQRVRRFVFPSDRVESSGSGAKP